MFSLESLERAAREHSLTLSHSLGEPGGRGHLVGVDAERSGLVFVDERETSAAGLGDVVSVTREASYRLGSPTPSAYVVEIGLGDRRRIALYGSANETARWLGLLEGLVGDAVECTDTVRR